jgi:uncharacterized protein (TIRG00374 family)
MKNRSFLATQLLLVAIGIGLVWLAVRNVQWRDVVIIFRQLNPRELVPILLLNLGVLFALSTRWWVLLRAFGFRLPFLRVMRYRTTVFAVGYLTPGPQIGGEVLAVYYPTRHKVPTSVALAAASVDKTLELLGNFSFIAIGSFIVLVGQHLISEADLIALGLLSTLLLIPVAVLVAIWRGKHPISGFMVWVEGLLPSRWRRRVRQTPGIRRLPSMHRLEATVTHSEDLIAWLCREHPWTLLLAVAATLGAWACTLTEFWLVTRALELLLTPAQAIGTLVLIYFAFTTPMPGGLGAVEAAILLAFTTFGFSPSQAVSLALFIRVRDLTEAAIGLLLGGVAWNKTQMPAPETATAAAEGLPPPVRSHAGAHAAKVDSAPPVLEKLDEDALPTTDFIAPEQRL